METQMDKVSYIIGRQIGGDFMNQGISINHEVFATALHSAMTGEESAISQDETQAIMTAFQMEMQEKTQAQMSAMGEISLKEGAEYLAKNKDAEGVQVTASGLQYKVLENGAGNTPSAESTVEVHYEGKLLDGSIFDSSYQRNETTSFPVNGVIPGWTEALQLMKEGDVWEVTIPSDLAYGANGAGQAIGPNATLIFKVELVSIK
ncbi:MAG: FKBP-type peptidyl-prolyl cis-trans isomerase [Bacteriovoracaceae bacterium]|nr:FKBP-type peptidyl-prolyl cis-trans isomerase [Bacteriovoracaceae bacterium]